MNYQIKSGDNLYEIAKKNNITVESIMKNNKNLNPYNLHIGSYIYLPINSANETLKEKMRKVWEQHVFWTRLLIVSIVDNLKDEKDTTNRLLRNANDLANVYQPYYSAEITNAIQNLITEHLVIGDKLVHAIADNNQSDASAFNNDWYKNADDIAIALSNINSHYDKEILRQMLYTHLDLTKEEVTNRLNQNYKKEIDVFDKVEEEALMMADYLSQGILHQYNRWN